jgi:hypothetical protein
MGTVDIKDFEWVDEFPPIKHNRKTLSESYDEGYRDGVAIGFDNGYTRCLQDFGLSPGDC